MGRQNAKKQQRKRQEKKRAAQRSKSASPYLRIGRSGELVACYANDGWEDGGQVAIYLLRSVPGGGHAMAAFLIDLWCMGLKDAWGRLEITRQEFNESILDRQRAVTDLVRLDLDDARRLVAGGIRFARENGFRLPRHYKRWTAMLGDLGDTDQADTSRFGVDGQLRFVGNRIDLERRLVGCSADAFLKRTDVEFIMGADDFTLMDDEELVLDDVAGEIADRAQDKVREWCFGRGIAPHPRLREAIELTLEAILNVESDLDDEDHEPGDETCGHALNNVERFLALSTPADAQALRDALDQFQGFIGQYERPGDMFAALGFDGLGDL